METAPVEAVGELEAGFWDLLEAFQSVSAELSRFKNVEDVAEGAVGLALKLTKSSLGFIGLVDESGQRTRVFSGAADAADSLPKDEIERIVAAAALPSTPDASSTDPMWDQYTKPGERVFRSYCGQPLQVGGKVLGTIGVSSPNGYTAAQRRAFAVFANQVAAALEIAQLEERRQDMVDALINLRAEVDRSERQRLITEERAQSVERVEKAHETAVAALLAVSVHTRGGDSIEDFYLRLTASIAELVGAGKILFWQLNENGTLTAIPGAHGVDDAFVARLYPSPCTPEGNDLTSRVVYRDQVFGASRKEESAEFGYVLDALNVDDAIAVAWRAGDQRLGLVAAYDSRRPEGFSGEDSWVLQKVGLAAGLVWQLKYAEADLKKTVERLQKVDSARQLLLKNVSTAVDGTRRRFASELHDDALQKLTAAELTLQRLQNANGQNDAMIGETQSLLAQTESALRRMLFEVRPPALELPGGFEETLRDRIAML
ncbi:MAG: GAF domain-containing protein, partial [Candidatus Dormibacteraceae bacterium]